MKHWTNRVGIAAACLVIAFLAPTVTVAKDSVIVVFDGSGSMWGQVDGKPKIEIAREVMGTLLQDWNEDIDLGLMVYGHREKGSCADIELVVPVSTPDGKRILNAVNGINPKGKTPISAALKQAAEDLRYTEDTATVILISDGEESCNADPCAVARELEAKGINFTAHVIGFDIKGNKQAQAQLKCVADSTGGRFFEAQNTEGLKEALAETAKAVAEPPPPPPGKTGVKLNAAPAEGAEPFSGYNEVTFAVYEDRKDVNGNRRQVGVHYDPVSVFELAPGNYVAVATRGNTRVETPIEVKPGELTEHTFVLGAGNLKLSAVPAEGAEPFSRYNDVTFTVYEDKKDLSGNRKEVGVHYDPVSVFQLTAGNYVVAAVRGNTRVETPIEVKPGELTEYTFVLNAGNLKLSAVPAQGAEPFSQYNDVTFTVYEDKKDLNGNRKAVGVHYDPVSVFQLTAGNYVAVAKRGNTQVETPIEVKAGELTEHTFILGAGNLKLSAKPAEGASPFSNYNTVMFHVLEEKKDLNGKRREVASAYEPLPMFSLTAGRYVAVAERGNVRVEAPIEVKPGELTEYTFVLNTGDLKLSAAPAEGAAPFSNYNTVNFSVFEDKAGPDGQRRQVGGKYEPFPEFQLAAGSYLVVAEYAGTRAEATVEVKPGELAELTLVLSSQPAAPDSGQPAQ